MKLKKKINNILLFCKFLADLVSLYPLIKLSISKSRTIFFFPYYHIGGAEEVHSKIVSASGKKSCILFTNGSTSQHFLNRFQKNAECIDISSFLTKNLHVKTITTKLIIRLINSSSETKQIFGSNSNYFYDVLYDLNSDLEIIDLTHAFSFPDYGVEMYSLKAVSRINKRLVICENVKMQYHNLYKEKNLLNYWNRIEVVKNGIKLPKVKQCLKAFDEKKIKLLFVGRNSTEKRFSLILKSLNLMDKFNINYTLNVIGPHFQEEIIPNNKVNYLGAIEDKEKINDYYRVSDFILISSEREGFPLVLMEAMSFGVVPISTNVGGIPEEIINGQNGFLLENSVYSIPLDIVNILKALMNNPEEYYRLSKSAMNYAYDNFNELVMLENYKNIFN